VRHGRESRWELDPEQLEEARFPLDRISAQWTRRLEALERHLVSMPDAEERSTEDRTNPRRRRR
jgi:hypothetical protein